MSETRGENLNRLKGGKHKSQIDEKLKEQLIKGINEEIAKSDEQISQEKLDKMLELLNTLDPVDEKEIEASKAKCWQIMQKEMKQEPEIKQKNKKKHKKFNPKILRKQVIMVASIVLAVVISLNIGTNASMDKNLFGFIYDLKHGVEVQYNAEYNNVVANQNENINFNTIEELEVYLGYDIMLPAYVPEGAELVEIIGNLGNKDFKYGFINYFEQSNNKYFQIQVFSGTNHSYVQSYNDNNDWNLLNKDVFQKNNVELYQKGDNYKICFLENKNIYQMQSDLSLEQIIKIVDSMEEKK